MLQAVLYLNNSSRPLVDSLQLGRGYGALQSICDASGRQQVPLLKK
jgi:hypothetical protein